MREHMGEEWRNHPPKRLPKSLPDLNPYYPGLLPFSLALVVLAAACLLLSRSESGHRHGAFSGGKCEKCVQLIYSVYVGIWEIPRRSLGKLHSWPRSLRSGKGLIQSDSV